MARILMTGMCSVQDRLAYHADKHRVFYRPFPEPVTTADEYLSQFRMAANTGNYLITEGAYRAFAGDEITYVPFWYLQSRVGDPDCIAQIREEYHVCLFATANILNADFDLTREVEVLEALDLPTVFMSIGVQRRSDLTKELHPSVSRFLDFLTRPSTHCFTRGRYAAEFLRSRGAANVFDACCPSAFHRPDSIIDGVRQLATLSIRDLGEIWVNGYLGNHARAADDLVQLGARTRRLAYVFQDEPLLFGATRDVAGHDALYDEATGALTRSPACHVADCEGKLSYLAFFSPEQWRARAAVVDLSVGRRFHGNLVVLQAGRPAIFVAHDDRVSEMLQSVGLPFIAPRDWDAAADKVALAEDFAHGVDVAAFEARYRARLDEFRSTVRTVRARVAGASVDVAAA
jgi:hypothetical protein